MRGSIAHLEGPTREQVGLVQSSRRAQRGGLEFTTREVVSVLTCSEGLRGGKRLKEWDLEADARSCV